MCESSVRSFLHPRTIRTDHCWRPEPNSSLRLSALVSTGCEKPLAQFETSWLPVKETAVFRACHTDISTSIALVEISLALLKFYKRQSFSWLNIGLSESRSPSQELTPLTGIHKVRTNILSLGRRNSAPTLETMFCLTNGLERLRIISGGPSVTCTFTCVGCLFWVRIVLG